MRTEADLRARGYKILTLHAYGYRSLTSNRPDYKVVTLDGERCYGFIKWDRDRRKWGTHPPLKSDRRSFRVHAASHCKTRVEAAHQLIDALEGN